MSKGAATRQAILDEGLNLSRVVGVTGVSVGMLADQLGMSKSGLYSHFGSKAALEVGILEHAGEQFLAEVVRPAWQERHVGKRLWLLFERWLDWTTRHYRQGGCVFIAAAAELDDRVSPARDYLVDIQREWLANLAAAIDRGVRRGELPADVDGEQVAHDLYATVMGYHHASRLLGDPRARQRAFAALERLIGPRPA